MSRGRLEAFSDGVLAIVITVMVLELAPPHGTSLEDLYPLWPKFLSIVAYALAIPIALYLPLIAVAIYIGVAAAWIVPDPRFGRSAAG